MVCPFPSAATVLIMKMGTNRVCVRARARATWMNKIEWIMKIWNRGAVWEETPDIIQAHFSSRVIIYLYTTSRERWNEENGKKKKNNTEKEKKSAEKWLVGNKFIHLIFTRYVTRETLKSAFGDTAFRETGEVSIPYTGARPALVRGYTADILNSKSIGSLSLSLYFRESFESKAKRSSTCSSIIRNSSWPSYPTVLRRKAG